MRRTKVYIAGPMTNGTGRNFNLQKIHEAIEAHFVLIERGYAPHCPHLTIFCEFMTPNRISYETWIDLDKFYVEDSDVVLRIPGDSKGADREVAHARERGIPVVNSLDHLLSFFHPTIQPPIYGSDVL